jgi:hypothetical protein
MRCSFFKYILVLNVVPIFFWNLLFFGFMVGTSETLLHSVFAPQVIPMLDVLQLLNLFAEISTYFEPKLFLLIMFYIHSFILLNYQFYIIRMYIYPAQVLVSFF